MGKLENDVVAPAGWVESLARSEAEIRAGQTLPLAPVLERLRAAADRLDAEHDELPIKDTAQTATR